MGTIPAKGQHPSRTSIRFGYGQDIDCRRTVECRQIVNEEY